MFPSGRPYKVFGRNLVQAVRHTGTSTTMMILPIKAGTVGEPRISERGELLIAERKLQGYFGIINQVDGAMVYEQSRRCKQNILAAGAGG